MEPKRYDILYLEDDNKHVYNLEWQQVNRRSQVSLNTPCLQIWLRKFAPSTTTRVCWLLANVQVRSDGSSCILDTDKHTSPIHVTTTYQYSPGRNYFRNINVDFYTLFKFLSTLKN